MDISKLALAGLINSKSSTILRKISFVMKVGVHLIHNVNNYKKKYVTKKTPILFLIGTNYVCLLKKVSHKKVIK